MVSIAKVSVVFGRGLVASARRPTLHAADSRDVECSLRSLGSVRLQLMLDVRRLLGTDCTRSASVASPTIDAGAQ